MSSLARRTLRTTAAAAGLAALGVGLAGHALAAPALPAAPELPAAPALPVAPPALPGTDGLPGADALAGVPSLPGVPSTDGIAMPGVANLEVPSIATATPGLPTLDAFTLPSVTDLAAPDVTSSALPEVPALPAAGPELPQAPGADSVNYDVGGLGVPSAEDLGGQNSVGALQAMDMAAFLTEMAQASPADGSLTENQQIG